MPALLLAAQAGAALCAALMRAVWPQLVQSGWGVWLATDIPLYGIAAPAALAWLRRAVPAGAPPGARAAAPLARRAVAGMRAGACLPCQFCHPAVWHPAAQQSGQIASLALGGSTWANALFGCVIAPLGEEWLFRRTLHGAVGMYGERVYVAFSALMFALFHCNAAQLYTRCAWARRWPPCMRARLPVGRRAGRTWL